MWVALFVAALITALRLTGTVDSDVAWQLWIAQRVHGGAHLYRDIIEVNPPLWFWMALPVDRVATLLHLRIEAVLILVMGGTVALSLAATDRLLDHIAAPRRTLLLGYGALILAAMPWMHVGQREQIALIAAMPYAALIAARRVGKPVPIVLAVLIGVGAALGFALKHYFLIVPALLELWLAAGAGRAWRVRRLEVIAMVAVGAFYAVAMLLWARDYLTSIVPLVRLTYGGMGAPTFGNLFGPVATLGIFMLGVMTVHWRLLTVRKAPFATALVISSVGFAAAYFIQAKGWPYHALPTLGCASLALAALLSEVDQRPPLLRLLAPALLLVPFVWPVEEKRNAWLPSPDLQGAISGLQRGDAVAFLATETAIPWSVTIQHDLRYTSRYMGFWMLIAVVRNERLGGPDPRLTQLGRQIVSETVTDFRCTPPNRIIVARPRPGEEGFDILPFFLRDPAFAELLSHYKVRSRTTLETFELVSPLKTPVPALCRHGV